MAGPFDVFLSYHHGSGSSLAERIAGALRAQGLTVFFDQSEIEDFDSITARLRDGVGRSKALVALYSETYPSRRACQFELTAAFLAAQRLGPPHSRVLVLNPEPGVEHIAPAQLRDALFRRVSDADDDAALADLATSVKSHTSALGGLLGDVAPMTPPRWMGMHPSSATRFVGRQAVMWELHSALHAGDLLPMSGVAGPGVAQVRGLGGIGKTLLAQEYALRFGAAFPGGVFWLRAGGDALEADSVDADALEAARLSQIQALADVYRVPREGLSTPGQIEAALGHALGQRGEPFLWVVDDIPSGLKADALRAWLAPHPMGRTLCTTRSRQYGALAPSVEPGVLSREEAVALLARHREPADGPERDDAAGLADDLGCHALAVDVAGAAVAAMPGATPFATFRSGLADPAEDAMEFAAELADVLPTGHSPSIAATLLASIDTLGPDGVDLLRTAAVLAAAPIPADFVVEILAKIDGEDERVAQRSVSIARTEARHASLLEPTEDGGSDMVHALVSRTIRFRAQPEASDRMAQLHEAAIAVVNELWRAVGEDLGKRRSLQPMLPHARHLAQTVDEEPGGLDLLSQLGDYDREDGAYRAARELHERVLAVRRRTLGEEHRTTLTAMGNLATTLWAQGDLDGAQELQRRVLAARRHVLGDEHPATLIAMGNLATTLRARGELNQARELQEQVLEAHRRVLGEDHPHTLTSINNLATTLRNQGELSTARKLQEEALTTFRRVLGDEHPDTLVSMGNTAATRWDQGDLHGAQELEEQVLDVRRRVLGEQHPATLNSMNNLAATLRDRGELKRAQELQEQALEGRRRVLGEEHPATLNSMNNVATGLRYRGELDRAQEMQEQVLEAHRRVLGEEHPDTLVSMSNLATTLWDKGDLDRTRELEEQVLNVRRRVLGDEHPATLISMGNLAITLRHQGELNRARELQEQALEVRRRVLGDEHPDTLTSMNNVAAVLREQGELDGARELHEQALEVRRRVLGEEHPDTLISAGNLATTLWDTGDLDRARELEEQVLNVRRRVLGDEHPDTLISMGNLAITLRHQGELKRARELQEQVLEVRRRVLGDEHPDTTAAAGVLSTMDKPRD